MRLAMSVLGLIVAITFTWTTRIADAVTGEAVWRNSPFTLARVDSCFHATTVPGTRWPLTPTDRSHAIRGSFNEPRAGDAPHFGVDVNARVNRADVYAMASGVVGDEKPTHLTIQSYPEGANQFFYWHVGHLPNIAVGSYVVQGQLIGDVLDGWFHVHVSELTQSCGWVNPMRPTGPLYVRENIEPPTIGSLLAFRATAAAFRAFPTGENPRNLVDPATPERLDRLQGVVDLRARVYDWPVKRMVERAQLELEPAAIRAWLAPADDRHRHVSKLKLIYDGATLFRPRLLHTTKWHVWAFGTWRQATGYRDHGPNADLHIGADYVWHVGGTRGLHTTLYPDGTYKFCIQALTINGRRATRCTPVVIDN